MKRCFLAVLILCSIVALVLPQLASAQNLTIVHSFNIDGATEEAMPTANLVQDTVPTSPTYGDFYGTTNTLSGFGENTVYLVTPGGAEQVVYLFGQNGQLPNDAAQSRAPLAQDTNPKSPTYGSFYGTSANGGTSGFGTVFLITPTSATTVTETVLHSFSGAPGDGNAPWSAPVQDTNPNSPTFGDFYGTTVGGGSDNNQGTVYLLTPTGATTATEAVLYSFGTKITDGDFIEAPLAQDKDPASPTYGDFYGTSLISVFSGSNQQFSALLFLVTPTSATTANETTLYQFGANGVNDGFGPQGGLTQDLDPNSPTYGDLYGTTDAGGAAGSGVASLRPGTVYLVEPTGPTSATESVVYSFGSVPEDGTGPLDRLTQDLNQSSPTYGDFFGTTDTGGTFNPNGPGVHGRGTIFEIFPKSTATASELVLHSFAGPPGDGAGPTASFVQDTVTNSPTFGNFWGTAPDGGVFGWGEVYRMAIPATAPPPAPTGLTASGGNAQVTLSWSASPGATSYNIYRTTTSGGEGAIPFQIDVTTNSFTDTTVTNGTTYYYQVTAVDAGESAKSNEVSATPSIPPASAVFVKQDTTTSGSWKGVYGADGFNIFTDTSSNNPTIPSYATVTPTGNTVYQWAAPSTSNPTYCLQQAAAGSTNRLAGVWYSPTNFSIDLNLTDGNAHQIALYLLAWLNSGLVETVTITDANSGATLDSRSVSSFSNGFYNVYDIMGHVKITIALSSGKNCVLSALFFDPKPAPPAAPTSLKSTSGNAQVALSWTASAGATSYNIKRSNSNGGPYTTVGTSTTTSFTDTTVTNFKTYFYVVTAVNTFGESGNSNQVGAFPTAPIPQPPTLIGIPGNAQVSLSWTASQGATSYNLYRLAGQGSEVLYQSGLTTTSFLDTGLTNGTTYFYQVTAVNGSGESNFSNGVSATPNTPPGTPMGLTANGGPSQVNLQWTAVSGANGYDIFRGTTSGGESSTPIATDVSGIYYQDTTVTNGTTYYYTVAAENNNVVGSVSNEASATPSVRLVSPADLIVTLSGGIQGPDFLDEYTLAGTIIQAIPFPNPPPGDENLRDAVLDQSGNVDAFDGTNNPFLVTFHPSSDTFTNQKTSPWGIDNVVNYGAMAAYLNFAYVCNESAPAGLIQFNLSNSTATHFGDQDYISVAMGLDGYLYALYPGGSPSGTDIDVYNPITLKLIRSIVVPTSVSGASTPGGAISSLAVDASGNIYLLGLGGFVYELDGNGNLLGSVAAGTFNAGNIDISPSGQIVISDIQGIQGPIIIETTAALSSFTNVPVVPQFSSLVESLFVKFIKNQPAPPTLTGTPGNGQVSLSWSAVNGAISYNVKRSPVTGGPYTIISNVTSGTTYTDTTVTNGATYYYVVNAVTANGDSADSNEAAAVPSANPPPAAPTNLTAIGGNAQVSLSWTASAGATSYNIYRATSSGGEGTTPVKTGVTTTSYTDTGLTNGTTYYYEVTAVNSAGESGKSNEASATPNSTASAVFIKQDTTTSGSWKGVYGSDGFNIFTDTSSNNPTIPSYATVTPTGNTVYQWAAPSTSNPTYCLQQAAAGSTNRLAGVWYSSSSFSIDLNLTDGNTHQVALYLLAWLNSSLVETVTITDANSGATLDTRSVSSFNNGDYEVYNISGHVKITITLSSGKNCVLSGIFFR